MKLHGFMATQNALLKNRDAPTKVLIPQQLLVLNFKILYQLNVMTDELYPMFRYVNYQIGIFMNINENIRNKRKIIKKLGGIHAKLSTSQLLTILY